MINCDHCAHTALICVSSALLMAIIQCYMNPQSSVRKSTVFCLVAMVNKLGREPVNPYLAPLSNSKVRCVYLR